MCSFVRQDDSHLLPALTARETIEYAALITLPRSISRKEKLEKADHILKVLGLKDCADTIVGNEVLKGLSGGEKRRLSIGLQMLTNPAVLVIDGN
jgi:ABC-type multidrug transport system ATPase subunit